MLCNVHVHLLSVLIYLIIKINFFFCLWDFFKRSSLNHVAWYYWLYTLLSFQTTISIFSSYINWHNCLIEHCNITQSTLFVLPHAPHTVVIYYPLLFLSVLSGTCSDELCLRLFSNILYFSTETKAYCCKG